MLVQRTSQCWQEAGVDPEAATSRGRGPWCPWCLWCQRGVGLVSSCSFAGATVTHVSVARFPYFVSDKTIFGVKTLRTLCSWEGIEKGEAQTIWSNLSLRLSTLSQADSWCAISEACRVTNGGSGERRLWGTKIMKREHMTKSTGIVWDTEQVVALFALFRDCRSMLIHTSRTFTDSRHVRHFRHWGAARAVRTGRVHRSGDLRCRGARGTRGRVAGVAAGSHCNLHRPIRRPDTATPCNTYIIWPWHAMTTSKFVVFVMFVIVLSACLRVHDLTCFDCVYFCQRFVHAWFQFKEIVGKTWVWKPLVRISHNISSEVTVSIALSTCASGYWTLRYVTYSRITSYFNDGLTVRFFKFQYAQGSMGTPFAEVTLNVVKGSWRFSVSLQWTQFECRMSLFDNVLGSNFARKNLAQLYQRRPDCGSHFGRIMTIKGGNLNKTYQNDIWR